MRELKEKINELNIKSQKLRTLSKTENMYYDLIERYEELTKKENSREPFRRKNLKEEDIEILLLDEEKENDKTL